MPFLAFEEFPELELEFLLAERLGMTLARMREEMPQEEWVKWTVYLGREQQRYELAKAARR